MRVNGRIIKGGVLAYESFGVLCHLPKLFEFGNDISFEVGELLLMEVDAVMLHQIGDSLEHIVAAEGLIVELLGVLFVESEF